MKERIEAIIQHERLTPSQFADSIGVQRSGVSHILSGRNKPSLDFLNKLLSKYPHISGDWLITGQGSMINGAKNDFKTNEQLRFPESEEKPKANFKMPKKVIKEEDQALYKKPVPDERPAEVTDKALSMPGISEVSNGKTIERIVVFYSDKTFREYKPE
ncbi:helix-turn-helix domain-containing protein [Carboxylicivirga sp. RSCT41]|uniref:helix-turn-helix domain-containing protein n=1 Tax=Carboxylicivirga agarovorans TaxID=3417570 RepID=UPI003D34BED3